MIKIYRKNTDTGEIYGTVLYPVPFVTISETPLSDKNERYASRYTITLNGTLVGDMGVPVYDPDSENAAFPEYTGTLFDKASYERSQVCLRDILYKQNAIRALFDKDFQRITISDINGDVIHSCKPQVESINFEEGTWAHICNYSVNLFGFNFDNLSYRDGLPYPSGGAKYIESFSDVWSIEQDDSYGQHITPKVFRLTRNLSATGATSDGNYEPWRHAKDYIKTKIWKGSNGQASEREYPYDVPWSGEALDPDSKTQAGAYANGLINIPVSYSGINHARSETIDVAAGSYSISDTWLLFDTNYDDAFESYTVSIQDGRDSPFTTVAIDGKIQGLDNEPGAIGVPYAKKQSNALENARKKYLDISKNGQFGVNSEIFKRVNNRIGSTLNSQPNSISLGLNDSTGEITYNMSFDTRPANIFSDVLSESINVNDTHPGDLFTVVPILGRSTGPILQHLGSRTEYRRDVGIEIQLNPTQLGYGDGRGTLIEAKPTLREPLRTELTRVISSLSPAGEPGIRKYFLSPPTESWNPKTGSYTLNLSWTYELDR